jgi:RNA 2',3'-cyclic 3'-phosphodiesterase
VRLFVALKIPFTVRENLAALIASLRGIAREPRWVRTENLHVTLKFLGQVAEDRLASVHAALVGIHSLEAVTLEFRGLGFFPSGKHPRVFWAGIEASANLKALAADIDSAMEKCGIAREKRDFSPHLTLARLEGPLPDALGKAIAEGAQREFGSLQTGEFHLMQSTLRASGAEYTTLKSFPFSPSVE